MFLAHHEQAPQVAAAFLRQVAELTSRGVDGNSAAMQAAEAVVRESASEVQRKIAMLRKEGQSAEGREALISQGLVQRDSAQDVLLQWERAGCKSREELDDRWTRCRAYFEAHVYRNVQAFAFNTLRREKALHPSILRSAACMSLLALEKGRALLAGMAEAGVGCLDGFAEPREVQSLHEWLVGLYEREGHFREEAESDCNRGSFNAVIDFEPGSSGEGPRWLSPPGLPPPAASVLARFVGLGVELQEALGVPLLLERQLHVGVYPAGGPLYSRHLDKYDFEVGNHRTVTVLLYTNPCADQQAEGGELVVYRPSPAGTPVSDGAHSEEQLRFSPLANRVVCFWSRTAYHEVLPSPAHWRPRFAITMWAQSGGSWRAQGFRPPARTPGVV